MTATDSSKTGRRSLSGAAASARLALVSLLVLLVALGVHGRFTTPAWSVHSESRDIVVAGALEVVAITLILVLWARSRRPPPGQHVAATLRAALLWVLGTGALALASTILVLLPRHLVKLPAPSPRPVPVCQKCSSRLPKPLHLGSFHFPIGDLLYALGAAVLVAAILALSVWAKRQSRKQPPPEPEALAEEYGEALEKALEGGRRALLSLDDARAAIIACYVAMEESLARAGTVRTSAETPDELLAKAASTLLIGAGAARRLTSLFYEARFSTHPLADKQKTAAAGALAEISSELGRAQPAPVGTEP